MAFSPIPEVLEDVRAGRVVILVDDPSRENEGDLVLAAEKVTPEAINFLRLHTGGVICLTMTEERADALDLPLQTARNTSRAGTAFTVSIEARDGVTTGISAGDRARTILYAARDACRPDDLVRPGHVFPIRARNGGVLVRAGHTEGSVDLARLAGLKPMAVVSEVMNSDGTMARLPDLERFAREHGLKLCSIADLIRYRREKERLIERALTVALPTEYGPFDLHAYLSKTEPEPHLVLTKGIPVPRDAHVANDPVEEPLLVRAHSGCLTGDVFKSTRCDCGPQLAAALERIQKAGRGVVLYMPQEGRGIGLVNKLRAYLLQQSGVDTVEANRRLGFRPDEREYGIAAQILFDLGVRKLRLLTNNPTKFNALRSFGLEIVERVPIVVPPSDENRTYLATKRDKLGHLLHVLDVAAGAGESPAART